MLPFIDYKVTIQWPGYNAETDCASWLKCHAFMFEQDNPKLNITKKPEIHISGFCHYLIINHCKFMFRACLALHSLQFVGNFVLDALNKVFHLHGRLLATTLLTHRHESF